MSENKQLGEFLRSRRHRLDPTALGLASARRRRTPGLRREEVAERAGISCEWYIKLEQGRGVSASAETLVALTEALALNAADAAHLSRLAKRSSPPPAPFERETVSAIVGAIVQDLPEPAYVTGARWDVLAWNAAADRLFGFAAMPEPERNILLYMFTDAAARDLFGENWAREAQRMVALFRSTHDQRADDPAFETLVAQLGRASPEFRSWWSSHDVETPSAGLKRLYPADGGEAAFVYASFQSNDDPTLKLSLYKFRPEAARHGGTMSQRKFASHHRAANR